MYYEIDKISLLYQLGYLIKYSTSKKGLMIKDPREKWVKSILDTKTNDVQKENWVRMIILGNSTINEEIKKFKGEQ